MNPTKYLQDLKYLRPMLSNSPEYYLIIVAILAGYSPPFSVDPVAIAVAALIILQILFKNKISGLLIGILFLLVNLFMMGALISEFNEFPTFSTDAKKLLFGGSLLLGINTFISILMIIKYAKYVESPDHSVTFG